MTIHDVAAIVLIICGLYITVTVSIDMIARKVGKIIVDKMDKEHHAPRH